MYNLKNIIDNSKTLKIANAAYDFINKKKNIDYFFDITDINTNKGDAIKYLMQYMNLNKEQSICFGDSINDYDMFKECGIKVAMKNSMPELIKYCDFVTLSNDENGVAHFFEKYIL